MNERRKIMDEQEARRCLVAARRTGKRVGVWARANGIDGRSLNAWQLNLARRGVPRAPAAARPAAAPVRRPPAALVELVPVTRPAAPARYTVHVGDVCLDFGDDVDIATLRRVVEALRSC